jgi:putative protease
LAAYDRLPELIAAGVSALKIEGRLKPPEYVASVTRHYRTAIDAICGNSVSPREKGSVLGPQEIAEMEQTFSRGFCHGWLDGRDHRSLVSGVSSAKRGTYLGEVRGVRGEHVVVELAAPVQRGDGVMLESDRGETEEQGGRVYEVFQGRRSVTEEISNGIVELTFRHGTMDWSRITLGQKVWKTDDPKAARRIRKTYSGRRAVRRIPLDITVEAAVGGPLKVFAVAGTGFVARVESPGPLPEAVKHPLTPEMLSEQFGRLGNSPYELRRLEAKISGRPMIPLSVLGSLRHEMLQRLDAAAVEPPPRTVAEALALDDIARQCSLSWNRPHPGPLPAEKGAELHVLCRSMKQIEAALGCGVSGIIADLQNIEDYREVVQAARAGGKIVSLATPRIHKPGESDVFRRLAACRPDGVLARNLAGLAFLRQLEMPVVADFSLNAVNEFTVAWLCARGARRVTTAYDLDSQRLLDLAAKTPPGRLEVVVHRHTPMFHTEYCLFCRALSHGHNQRDCGRPCDRSALRLRDRRGVEHLLLPDSQCRNTLFHAKAESLLSLMPTLRNRGVRHFRVELLSESRVEEVRHALAPYRDCTVTA